MTLLSRWAALHHGPERALLVHGTAASDAVRLATARRERNHA
jgi:hypothetical protein